MPTYTNGQGKIYTYADGQPDFDTWVNSDPQRQASYQQAVEAYQTYKTANNGTSPTGSDCDRIWKQWVSTVQAQIED